MTEIKLNWRNWIKIRWLGDDQYTQQGLIRKGEEREFLAPMAIPWIQDGWAEEVKPAPMPEAKTRKSKTTEE